MRDSRHLRQRVTQFSKQAVQSNTLKGERTCQELEAKIRHTAALSTRLQSRLDEIDQELADVRAQQASIHAALQDKQAPLHVCARRLALRRKRPERERVRDEAEITLQSQLDRLVRNCRHLEEQSAALVNREKELLQLREQLDMDRRDKESARDLDTELLTLDPGSVVGAPAVRNKPSFSPSPFGPPPVYRPPSSSGGRTPSSLLGGAYARPRSAPPGKNRQIPLAAY